jgi:hypothetical protein
LLQITCHSLKVNGTFSLRALKADEIAQQTLKARKNTEARLFECGMTGMRLCNLQWRRFSALTVRCGVSATISGAALLFGSLFHKE